MDKYQQTTQAFSIMVAIVLVFIFFVFLAANFISGESFITPLILIINGIILLAIFIVLSRIEYCLTVKKRK